MTVRINKTAEHSISVVSVAGRLDNPVVSELLKICHSIEGEYLLDLAGLLSVDSDGIEAIHKLVQRPESSGTLLPRRHEMLHKSLHHIYHVLDTSRKRCTFPTTGVSFNAQPVG